MPEIGSISGECRIRLSCHAVWHALHGNTGRSVRGDAGYRFATEWAAVETHEELLQHPAAEEFKTFMPDAMCLAESDDLVFFRGRCVDGPAPTADQMGPPPLEFARSEGRYHKPGEAVLYLSDSEDGVRRELANWQSDGAQYLQRFRLPLGALRIADFSSAVVPSDHFVAQVFSKAEECKIAGRGPDSYLFSQTVAALVKEAGFDGMRIPGVRGEPGAHYNNVVVFQPHPKWPDWLEPGSVPYVMPTD